MRAFAGLVVSLGVLLAAGSQRAAADCEEGGGWRFPGEYERHDAMWMLWPTFEYKAGFPPAKPMSEMIAAMHGHTPVRLAVQDAVDEAAARSFLRANGVPLEHVQFHHLRHDDIWARDMGPQFTRSRSGELRINDWGFNMWGAEEPGSALSTSGDAFDRAVAVAIRVPTLPARAGSETGAPMVHEGGAATHNGHGTMIVAESVVMQRNLGPNRFCGGQAPVTDYAEWNTYAPNLGWPACKARVEAEYRRMLGVQKVIWVPTGVVEDNGTYRGALGQHIQVPRLQGVEISHPGVYTVFTTNGHVDEFVRFVAADKVVLAEEELPRARARSPVERLVHWLQEQNHARLERVHDILARETTESGTPIQIVRIPTPELTLEVFRAGDGAYDYWSSYNRWEDGSQLPELMLGVWASSYVNYVPTNGLVLVPKYWKPGRSEESRRRDSAARRVLGEVFPGRKVVAIHAENINRGGGGMNCITQQQPASAKASSARPERD